MPGTGFLTPGLTITPGIDFVRYLTSRLSGWRGIIASQGIPGGRALVCQFAHQMRNLALIQYFLKDKN